MASASAVTRAASNAWKDALLVSNSCDLIEAARCWLPDVKSPYNKHELIERLEAFLKRNVETILSYLDKDDLRIIATALYLGHAEGGGLFKLQFMSMLSAENYIDEEKLEKKIAALEEKLILYTYYSDYRRSITLIAPAPPLVPELKKRIPSELVFKTLHRAETPRADDPLDFWCAFMSAGLHTKNAFKNDGLPTKKMQAALEAICPEPLFYERAIINVSNAFVSCGVITMSDEHKFMPDPKRFVELSEHAQNRFLLMLIAAALLPTMQNPYAKGGVETYVYKVVYGVVRALPRKCKFAERDLWVICLYAMEKVLCELPEKCQQQMRNQAFFSTLLDTLYSFNIITLNDDKTVSLTQAALAMLDPPSEAHGSPMIVIEESHEIRLMPQADSAARAFIACTARIQKTGLVWSATLDKAAAKIAFACGFSADELLARFETLSARPLPVGFAFSIREWEKEAASVRLALGTVVRLSGRFSGMLEHSLKGKKIIQEKLADDIFILKAKTLSDAVKLLKTAGIDVDYRAPSDAIDAIRAKETYSVKNFDPTFSGFGELLEHSLCNDTAGDEAQHENTERAAMRKASHKTKKRCEELLDILQSMRVEKEKKLRLAERIEDGWILDEPALRRAASEKSPTKKTEGSASFISKMSAIEKAYKRGYPLEIRYIGRDSALRTVFGIPRKLDIKNAVVTLCLMDNSKISVPLKLIQSAQALP